MTPATRVAARITSTVTPMQPNHDQSSFRSARLPLTKIIATIGPATSDLSTMVRLITAGVSVFRLNFSHGNMEEHAARVRVIREAAEEAGRPVAILGDLPGPKIRIGPVPEPGIVVTEGTTVRIAPSLVPGQLIAPGVARVGCTYDKLAEDVQPGQRVLINDGAVRMLALRKTDGDLECTVTFGGLISTSKGVNLPDTELSLDAITPRDWELVEFAIDHEIDFLAMSFVSTAHDVRTLANGVRERFAKRGKSDWRLPIIAKIERPKAVERIDEIVDAADAIMIARGDLGVEMDLARVPIVQKRLAAVAQDYGTPCIVATQMLQSMIESNSPTRAEVTDVAAAIFDAVDAVMLSGETAVGKHPALAVEMMRHIANETEAHLASVEHKESAPEMLVKSRYRTAALAHGVWTVANDLDAAFVIVWSQLGGGARYLSQNNFHVPIVAVSTDDRALRRMQLLRGVIPVRMPLPDGIQHFMAMADEYLLATEWAKPGEHCVFVVGEPLGVSGVTNTLIIHEVGKFSSPEV